MTNCWLIVNNSFYRLVVPTQLVTIPDLSHLAWGVREDWPFILFLTADPCHQAIKILLSEYLQTAARLKVYLKSLHVSSKFSHPIVSYPLKSPNPESSANHTNIGLVNWGKPVTNEGLPVWWRTAEHPAGHFYLFVCSDKWSNHSPLSYRLISWTNIWSNRTYRSTFLWLVFTVLSLIVCSRVSSQGSVSQTTKKPLSDVRWTLRPIR